MEWPRWFPMPPRNGPQHQLRFRMGNGGRPASNWMDSTETLWSTIIRAKSKGQKNMGSTACNKKCIEFDIRFCVFLFEGCVVINILLK